MSTTDQTVVRLDDYRPPAYLIDRVDLDVRLHPSATRVTAVLAIRPAEGTPAGTPLVLDGDGLRLEHLLLDGRSPEPEAYAASPVALTLHRPPAQPFRLEIETVINPEANSALMGLYRSSGTYCTQCEAEGFRRITYFLDRPDVLAVYTTRIEADRTEAPVLLGNGNPVEAGPIAGTERHYAIWHDPHPKPAYLFALVAGRLASVHDTFTTRSGRLVRLAIHVEPGKEDMCGWAMDSLKRSMAWDEHVFGLEYDLDVFNIVAVSDFNMGAMENKGLNIFNDKYVLADPETATDQDYGHVEAVIAHEYFHNWTGNRITCRDWFQLCLKEGLTVFRDQEFSSDMRSRPVKRIADVRMLKSHQFPEDAGPLAHPVRPRAYREINNFYTATVYEKGAEVVRMLKTLLGAEDFAAGMALYIRRHDGDAATIEQFLACFAEAGGRDLEQFALWYEQAGTPRLEVTSAHDPDTATLSLTLTQSLGPTPGQASKLPMLIPVRLGLIGPEGADIGLRPRERDRVQGDVLLLSERSQTFTFDGVTERPVVSLLRGFSAPVTVNATPSPADLLFLLQHDSDPFNRWQAAQDLATRELMRLYAARRKGDVLAVDAALVSALGDVLTDEDLDPAFRAQVLHLPGEADLARDIGRDVDPDAILSARTQLRHAIGRAHGQTFASLADRLGRRPFAPDAADAGERTLKGLCLAYLAVSDQDTRADIIARHAREADNMTDRIAALSALVHEDLAGADTALAAFERRHAGHPLAMDKWFTVQATSPHAGTLTIVDALTRHPAFDWTNPNRVRALVGAFTTGNQSQFTRPDGAGFVYLGDVVERLDQRNPQLAARLVSAFRSWQALEPKRAALAEGVLSKLAGRATLSKDTRDIVERCLA
ncbi:aminopeptidase N [Pannonibacter tanglangensis]|uniref:Aminopeptidase N n=1 Tax=Pannonibacter tanglangensis TaxID=2750084 RepID=A0ABW9ZIC0_9HYPH|nr:aminopeptidase N [Pannonibacter sp. XCT-34]NBN62864.1 aminopeptidase N [Pannonibacter sp. XCT-34]